MNKFVFIEDKWLMALINSVSLCLLCILYDGLSMFVPNFIWNFANMFRNSVQKGAPWLLNTMYKEYTDGTNISYAAFGALFARQE